MIDFNKFIVFASSADEKKAAELFAEEIRLRTGNVPEITDDADKANFIFRQTDGICRDGYVIDCGKNAVTLCLFLLSVCFCERLHPFAVYPC